MLGFRSTNGPYLRSEQKLREWWVKGRPEKMGKGVFKMSARFRDTLYKNYNGFCLLAGVSGPFELLSMPLGFSLMARLMRKKPELVHEVLERNWGII